MKTLKDFTEYSKNNMYTVTTYLFMTTDESASELWYMAEQIYAENTEVMI